MIGKFLGHRQVQTTARYAHLARNSVKTDAVRISDSLEADMNTPPDILSGWPLSPYTPPFEALDCRPS